MSGNDKPRAMIAMSGGVDSSVAALFAKKMGYECVGVTMKLFGDTSGAEKAAERLGIEHRTIDFAAEFRAYVIEPFIRSYEKGETPNPCVVCNEAIKFGLLYEYARAEGFDKFITGHYANIEERPKGIFRLKKAAYTKKDQSYFLYALNRKELKHIWFPLGDLNKKEVRVIAEEAGLGNADKPDSQDVCFILNGGYAEFIEKYRGYRSSPGNFINMDGRILGHHRGIEHYTIGQRKGLGIALGYPVFVKEIRPLTGEVVLAGETELLASAIEITDVVWQKTFYNKDAQKKLDEASMVADAVVRYNAKPVRSHFGWGRGGNIRIVFEEPVRAPARGQSAVLYDGDYVTCGGRISDVW